MTKELPWNSGWWYKPGPIESKFLKLRGDGPNGDDEQWISVHLPHDMTEPALNSFNEKSLSKKACYAKALATSEIRAFLNTFGEDRTSLPLRSLMLRFEGVAVSCRIWVNGHEAGAHAEPFTPFEVKIDPFLQGVSQAWIVIEVESAEDPAIPPFGEAVDYLVYGGIYRGVSVIASTGARLGTVWGAPRPRGDSLDGVWFVEIYAKTLADAQDAGQNFQLRARLFQSETLVVEGTAPLQALPDQKEELDTEASALESLGDTGAPNAPFSLSLEHPRLWDIDAPFLYSLEICLLDGSGAVLDKKVQRIGFRTAEFGPSGFYLNHKRVFLRGLNRHQEFPYSGYAMGPEGQRRDAEILKHEMGCVIVRTSHYPQSPHFLDACDEVGLLVFEEIPGWQHIGDMLWQEKSKQNLRDMILRDRNHPSIVLWGVRINESKDNHEFYTTMNELSKTLDPYRPTAGVRCIAQSELLEDVYTFNDFTYDGKGTNYISEPRRILPRYRKNAAYLITEHTGHMYPTKRFDSEQRLAEHALRHAHILDAAMGNAQISGCIGWCAFDYHTNKDFGAGDRVCYHGVADMFRLPKYAASFYGSQVSPSERIVLEPASCFAKGARDAARILPIYVFTNCDAVDLYRGGDFIARFSPDKENFANLPHPPIVIDDFIGAKINAEKWNARDTKLFCSLAAKAMAMGASRFSLYDNLRMALFMRRHRLTQQQVEDLVIHYGMGWGSKHEKVTLIGILSGREVAERSFGADSAAQKIVAEADALTIRASDGEEWSSTRIVAKALDQYGNIVPFLFEPFSIAMEGPVRLIGPAQRALIHGASAFWIAAGAQEGIARITISCARFEEPALVEIAVR